MKEITKTVYNYDELSESAKEKVLEKFYDINIYDGWWENDYLVKWEEYGIKADEHKMYFDLDRGSYLYFDKEGIFVDNQYKLARAIYGKGYGILASKGLIEFYFQTNYYGGGIGKTGLLVIDNRSVNSKELPADAGEWFRNLIEEYLSYLRKQYFYLTSKEAIEETIRINNYTFDEKGNQEG